MIIMEDVTKTYSTGVAALNGINLHIQKGEFVFIVGKSGSGKSTLIKLLLKELDPTSGKIYVNKKYLNKITRKKLPYLRRDIGVVFQDFRLLPDRNVYENIAFAQKVVEAPNRKIKSRVLAMLSMVGLLDKYKAFLMSYQVVSSRESQLQERWLTSRLYCCATSQQVTLILPILMKS